MVGGEVSGLQRSKREDPKECGGDSQISLESGYQQGVTGLSVGEGLGTIRVTLGPQQVFFSSFPLNLPPSLQSDLSTGDPSACCVSPLYPLSPSLSLADKAPSLLSQHPQLPFSTHSSSPTSLGRELLACQNNTVSLAGLGGERIIKRTRMFFPCSPCSCSGQLMLHSPSAGIFLDRFNSSM